MGDALQDEPLSKYTVEGIPLTREVLDASAKVAMLDIIRDCSFLDLLRIIVRVRYLGWPDQKPT